MVGTLSQEKSWIRIWKPWLQLVLSFIKQFTVNPGVVLDLEKYVQTSCTLPVNIKVFLVNVSSVVSTSLCPVADLSPRMEPLNLEAASLLLVLDAPVLGRLTELFVLIVIMIQPRSVNIKQRCYSVADLRGCARDPPGSKFFEFHAVFGKIWQNRMLAPPWGVGAPSSGKSWIRHCYWRGFRGRRDPPHPFRLIFFILCSFRGKLVK